MKKSKKRNTIMLLILLVCGITIGFALLSTTLYINGSGIVKGNKWDIHWENVDNEDGVDAQTPVIDSNKTTVTYEINLVNPGDFYSFTVDAVNKGTLDGVINSVESKFYESDGETEIELPSYLSYSVTYEDGSPIEKGQRLNSQEEKTYKVKVKYNTNVDSSELPTTNQTILSKFTVEYVQADVEVDAVSFAKDPWDVIADCAKLGTCPYEVGDTRIEKIDIDGDGTEEEYTLRIANMSTPSECSQPGFSQTACGFVVEFQDTIEAMQMNPTTAENSERDNYNNPDFNVDTDIIKGVGNQGGWEYSNVRAYLNGKVYAKDNIDYSSTGFINKLPQDLKKVLKNTTVVSGYGCVSGDGSSCVTADNGGKYYVTTDKIFLFSPREIWDFHEGSYGIEYDSGYYGTTRQLDYYASVNPSEDYYGGASDGVKKKAAIPGNSREWWLRTPRGDNNGGFFYVGDNGAQGTYWATSVMALSPAFRIG